MIASLGMYDRPETAAANDRLWRAMRAALSARGLPAPSQLNRTTPYMETWQSPDLLFSQTCGLPFRQFLSKHVRLIATPDYGHRACPPGYYRSAFIVRTRDPRVDLPAFCEARFACNEKISQSGWAAAQNHVAELGFRFENTLETGGHVASAAAVAEGHADIAAIDALSWDMIKRYEDFSLELRVLAWTTPTPGLPYITGAEQPVELLFAALSEAIDALDLQDRRTLRLQGLVRIPAADYLAVPNP